MTRINNSIYYLIFIAILSSGCGGPNFYKSQYPNALKQGKLKKAENTEAQNDVATYTRDPERTIEVLSSASINLESSDSSTSLAEVYTIQKPDSCLTLTSEVSEKKMDKTAQIAIPMTSENITSETDDVPEEEPNAEEPQKKRVNRNSLIAILLIPLLFVSGILVIVLLFQDFLFLAGLLLVAIGVGCVVSIVKASRGMREIKDSKGKQKGNFLSVLAILASTFGLLLTGLLIWVVFNY
jgi:hypothetical protein